METYDGELVHSAVFLNSKEAGSNAKSSLRKKVEMIVPGKGDKDRQILCDMLLGVI